MTVPSPQPPLVEFLSDPTGTLRRAAASAARSIGVTAGRAAPYGAVLTAAAALAYLLQQRAVRRAGADAHVVRVFTPPEPDPAGAETFWSNLHALLRRPPRVWRPRPHVTFELAWSESGLRIALRLPATVSPPLVQRAVEAAWPAARTTVEAAAAESDVGTAVDGRLRLARPGWLPLRTDFDADPLRPLLGAATPSFPGEQVRVLVAAHPATSAAVARCRRAARELRAGRPGTRRIALLDLLTPGPTAPRPARTDPDATADVRAILDKASAGLWQCQVTYAVTSPRAGRAVRRALRTRARAVAAAFALYDGRNRLVPARLTRPHKPAVPGRDSELMSTRELAAIAHLPLDQVVPNLARAGARSVPPPPDVPSRQDAGKVLGDADAGPPRPVVLKPVDARYHLHVMGSTGSGKSTLLTNLVLQDVAARRGCVVIDPKGDLVTDILTRLPAAARDRVNQPRSGEPPILLLDPAAPGEPPTLNMLERVDGVPDEVVVDHLVGICARIFDPHWGPRIEDTMRAACLTGLRRPGTTLAAIPHLLTLPSEWQDYLGQGDEDADLRLFWAAHFAQGAGQRSQISGPLLYKLRAFLLRPFVRKVVNAETSTIDLDRVLDGGLLLARLPKGILGEETTKLLGSFIVAKTWQAAMRRAALDQTRRRDAALVVDECQNFLNLPRSFDDLLAEARGYGLSLVVAHQHLGQLPRELRDAISANARNKILFTCSPEDAHVLERHMTPQLSEHDLANLAAYQAAVRLVVAGADQPAFTLRTRPAPPPREAP